MSRAETGPGVDTLGRVLLLCALRGRVAALPLARRRALSAALDVAPLTDAALVGLASMVALAEGNRTDA